MAKAHVFLDVDMHEVTTPVHDFEVRAGAGSKVVITIGPQCQEVQTLVQLLHAGVTCARVDLSWGTLEYHTRSLRNLAEAMKATRRLCRWAGPRRGAGGSRAVSLGCGRVSNAAPAQCVMLPLLLSWHLPPHPNPAAVCGWTRRGARSWCGALSSTCPAAGRGSRARRASTSTRTWCVFFSKGGGGSGGGDDILMQYALFTAPGMSSIGIVLCMEAAADSHPALMTTHIYAPTHTGHHHYLRPTCCGHPHAAACQLPRCVCVPVHVCD